MLRRVVTLKLIDVSDMRTASILRAMMEAVHTSEMYVSFNVTTRRYIPEVSKLKEITVSKTVVGVLNGSLWCTDQDNI
jgi:hypothetical protein